MDKKKILILIDWFLPAYKAGGPISSIRNLSNILKEDHEVFILAGNKDLGEKDTLPVETGKWISKDGINVFYADINELSKDFFQKIFLELNPDIVHLNSMFSKLFTLVPLSALKEHKDRIIVSPRGMLGEASLKIKPFKKSVFFSIIKVNGLFKGVRWHATTEIEKNEIRKKFGSQAQIAVANNVAHFPTDVNFSKRQAIFKLLFVGRVVPIKNLELILKSLNGINSKVHFRIVGPLEDDQYLSILKELVAKLPENITVEFLGGLSFAQLPEIYSTSDLFISATKNENFGHSIIEAMGFGLPVILSQKTPWRNLENVKVGIDLPFEEKSFQLAINRFIQMNDEDFNIHQENSRMFARNIFNKDELKRDYCNLYGF